MAQQTLFCPLRKVWINALPEECVRITLLRYLIEHLHYPPGYIALEKSLSQLPQIASDLALPNRRIDIVVYSKNEAQPHQLYPLLLIECKAVKITQKTMRQVIGYNYFIRAPYIAAVNQTQALVGYYQAAKQEYTFQTTFPSFSQLVTTITPSQSI